MIPVGSRVHVEGEGVGIVEEVYADPATGIFYGVRWLTPDNKPSVLTTFGIAGSRVCEVGANVLPQPRSAAWKAESGEFYDGIVAALAAWEEGE